MPKALLFQIVIVLASPVIVAEKCLPTNTIWTNTSNSPDASISETAVTLVLFATGPNWNHTHVLEVYSTVNSNFRSFEKRDRLRIHILHVHEKYKPHVCAACGKAFSQSSSLNKHMWVLRRTLAGSTALWRTSLNKHPTTFFLPGPFLRNFTNPW